MLAGTDVADSHAILGNHGLACHESRKRTPMLMSGGGKRHLLMLFLGGLPIAAVALGALVVTHGPFVSASASSLLTSQLLLFVTAVLVVGVGSLVIWRTVASLGRATEIETLEKARGARWESSDQSGPVVNSVSRMLTTIERQATELDHVSQQLDTAHRELASAKAQLREVSFIDDVTKLHNRRFLFARLEEEVARYRRFGRPVSLVLVALDRVPLGNGAEGHLAVDEILRGVAEILSNASSGADVICRYGHDTFAVLLVETTKPDAYAYAERVSQLLSTPSLGGERQMTASVGIASLPQEAGSIDDILRGAEEALQTARRADPHRVAAWAGAACQVEP
jgi:diguanylate cyclase (GGDEF)-like protein